MRFPLSFDMDNLRWDDSNVASRWAWLLFDGAYVLEHHVMDQKQVDCMDMQIIVTIAMEDMEIVGVSYIGASGPLFRSVIDEEVATNCRSPREMFILLPSVLQHTYQYLILKPLILHSVL